MGPRELSHPGGRQASSVPTLHMHHPMSPLHLVYAWGAGGAGFAWGAPCREGPLRCSRGLLFQEGPRAQVGESKPTFWRQPDLHPPGWSRGPGRGLPRPCPGCPGRAAPAEARGRRPATSPGSEAEKRSGAWGPGGGGAGGAGRARAPPPASRPPRGRHPRPALQVAAAAEPAAARGPGRGRGGGVPGPPPRGPPPVMMSQSRRAPAFPGRLRAPSGAGSGLLSHGLPLAPPLPLPPPRRAPPQGLALARRLRGGGAAGNGCAPFGSSAVLALLPAAAGAVPAVLMGHGGEGGGQRGLPGAAGRPEGRRRPLLRHIRGPGRHPPGRPAPHPGAAAALEARASSDQGSRAGAGPGWGPVGAGAGMRGRLSVHPSGWRSHGCAGQGCNGGLGVYFASSVLAPKQSQAPTSLGPHTPPPPAPTPPSSRGPRAAGGPPAHRQQAARAGPTPCRRPEERARPALKPEEAGTFKGAPHLHTHTHPCPFSSRWWEQSLQALSGSCRSQEPPRGIPASPGPPRWVETLPVAPGSGSAPPHRGPPHPQLGTFSGTQVWAEPPTEEPQADSPAALPPLKRLHLLTLPRQPLWELRAEEGVLSPAPAASAGVAGARCCQGLLGGERPGSPTQCGG